MFLKIAHRGASKKEPENTLRAFQRALSLGSTFIECDVHKCKSGEIVVMHDDTVNRTTNGRGKIKNKTFAELRALDGEGGERIPRIQEVINLIHRKARLNIELKKDAGADVARILMGYYAAGWNPTDFLVSSFSKRELVTFRKYDKETPVALLIDWKTTFPIRFAKRIGAYSVNPGIKQTTPLFVRRAHKNGLKVFVYVVNSKDEMGRLKAMGVDGVFSDCLEEL